MRKDPLDPIDGGTKVRIALRRLLNPELVKVGCLWIGRVSCAGLVDWPLGWRWADSGWCCSGHSTWRDRPVAAVGRPDRHTADRLCNPFCSPIYDLTLSIPAPAARGGGQEEGRGGAQGGGRRRRRPRQHEGRRLGRPARPALSALHHALPCCAALCRGAMPCLGAGATWRWCARRAERVRRPQSIMCFLCVPLCNHPTYQPTQPLLF